MLPRSHDNSLRVVCVSNHIEMSHAYAIRAICFMEQAGLSAAHAFDGNDFHATHFVYYLGDEPIGASRVRFFANFAKIERTGFRKRFSNVRTIKRCAEEVFKHVARKGYPRIFTFAEVQYAEIWTRFLGFKQVTGQAVRRPNEETDFFELVKELELPDDVLTEHAPIQVLIRTEGAWNVPASFG